MGRMALRPRTTKSSLRFDNSDLRVGDVLGVVFYDYQPTAASR